MTKKLQYPVSYDPFAGGPILQTVQATEPQIEIWTSVQLGDDANCAFNESIAVTLTGTLDREALIHALEQLINRHDGLRTTFSPDGQTLIVGAEPRFDLTSHDFSQLNTKERQQQITSLLTKAATTPFDLEKGPLFRVNIARIKDHEHILLLTSHHIICDGWSIWVILEELGTLYTAQNSNTFAALNPPYQFSSYAAQQQERKNSESWKADDNFWLEKFSPPPPLLDLPTTYKRPTKRSFRAARKDYTFPAQVVRPLKAYAVRKKTTITVILLSAFSSFLSRLSGQDDPVIGVPAAGQAASGHHYLIGHCVNLLPMRCAVNREDTFESYLERYKQNMLDAFDHQQYTYGSLLQKLKLPRDIGRPPLVSVLFNIDQGLGDVTYGELAVGYSTPPRAFENFEIFLNASEIQGELKIECQYSTALFSEKTISHRLQEFEYLLENLLADPLQPLCEAALIPPGEQQVLDQWNDTNAALPPQGIHNLVEKQAEEHPDKKAILFSGLSITYKILNQQAGKLAVSLQAENVHCGSLVGLYLPRSIEMVVAMLAVLKAGGAYVPLDPKYPEQRISYMVENSAMALILTNKELGQSLPDSKARQYHIDSSIPDRKPNGKPMTQVEPDDLAYVIYTSGSTGQPKGVQVHHRAVVNFLTSMAESPGIQSSDTLLAVTTFSFDIAALEIFLPLTTGATLALADTEEATDGYLLQQLINSTQATVMQATPATWRILLKSGWKPTAKFKVLCGGEPFPQDLAEQLTACSDNVWNMYGPTETTIWSSCHKVSATETTLFIGRPIANTQMYVLDEEMNPMPIGVAGELYIGGAGVSKGYLNRPGLTAQQFVPNPFGEDPDALLYKTGDLARYHDNGLLECLGRIDSQVKVRGYRIELGEIESVLSQHPAVSHAVVNVYEIEPGDQRLVAYIIPDSEEDISVKDIRHHLGMQLPEYMIPQHIVTIESFPLTPAGKIDKKALPFPDEVDRKDTDTFTLPETGNERTLLAIWQNILSVKKIGTSDNFFDLGGHSLLATQAIAQIKKELKVSISLRQFFENPTIHGLAALSDEVQKTDIPQTDLVVPRRVERGFAVMSLQQQRLWYLYQFDNNSTVYNLPAAFKMIGHLDKTLFVDCINAIFKRHDTLRTAIEERNGTGVQVIVEELLFDLPVVDLSSYSSEEKEEKLKRALIQQTQKSYDLSDRPLFRALLYKLAANEHVFFFMPHHSIWDGWSFDVFLNELRLLYEAGVEDKEAVLPVLPVQYADFAEWQVMRSNNGGFDKQLAYWQKQLAGELPVLNLHTDFPRPARMSASHAASESIFLSREHVDLLRAIARKEDATLFMTLFAAFNVLFFTFTGGQNDIIVGAPISGRNNAETAHLLGFFVNTLVLRSRITAEISFSSFLQQVKETCLGAFNNQEAPFEKIIELINPTRDLSRSPIFQILFIFQDTRNRKSKIANLRLEQVNVARSGSQTDIDFWVRLTDSGLAGGFEYNSDLYEAQTIQRLCDQYISIIDAIIKNSHAPVREISALPENEYNKIVYAWNKTVVPFPDDSLLQRLIGKQVEKTPDAPAVIYGKECYSYSQLDNYSNQLANYLIKSGVQPGSLVGICVERSLDMIVCLLGILKAGAAYVPLDPNYPKSRLSYMISDADMTVLLTQEKLAGGLSEHDVSIICFDSQQSEISACTDEDPAVQITPDDLAYIIYTSGSTGQPKGVKVHHRAVVNFLNSMAKEPGISAGDTLLAVTTLSFDIAVLELFLPLTQGAVTIVLDRESSSNGELLKQALQDRNVTIMQATPSTWRLLLAAGWQGNKELKILCGGEPFPKDLVQELLPKAGSVWNMYGPTETTVWSTCCRLEGSDGTVLIGKPIDNTQIYILDANLQLTPVGVPGELHIGGVGVTKGYHNRPALTEEHFIPNPFSNDPDSLLYKTGDLARFHEDGSIEHLNRIDSQVKVRGYRIELGEIESALVTHAAVKQAVASVKEFSAGDQRLVVYIVPDAGKTINTAEIRKHLHAQLPDFMIPQHVVEIEDIPLTPAGKVDRRNLPRPDLERSQEKETVVPQTELEKQLAAIWKDVLQWKNVGIEDNFFDIGGHSLLTLQIIARIRDTLHVELSLATLFEHQTIADLARFIDARRYVAQDSTSSTSGDRVEIEL